jgi:hypothetical protein
VIRTKRKTSSSDAGKAILSKLRKRMEIERLRQIQILGQQEREQNLKS